MDLLRALFTGRRLLATLVVALGVVVLCGFGFWQLDRGRQRAALNARIDSRMSAAPLALDGGPVDADALDYRRVTVRGTFDSSQEIVLRNRSFGGVTGVHVLTPLRLANGTGVLVDRGWLPMELAGPAARRPYGPPPGEVTIEGVARQSQHNLRAPVDPPLAPGEARLDAWFRVDIPRIQQQVGSPLLPIFIEHQPAPDAPELPARTATRDLGPGPHLSYAIQWFSFAVIMVGAYLAWTYQQLRRPREA